MIFDLQLFAVINNESVEGAYIFNDGKTNVVGTADADSIYNEVKYATIDAGAGNDSIRNWGYNAMINAGAGNDSIKNEYGENVSINAGAGNDSIKTCGWYATINAGEGNDTISFYYSSIWNDTDDAEYTVIEYAAGDGHDIINGYNSDDTISITDGSAYSTASSGIFDVIIKVGAGSLTLEYASDKTINIVGGSNVSSLPKGVKLNGTGKTLTFKKPFEGTINSADYGSKVKTINASSNKGMVELIGNDLNNVIKASKGGSTLEGAGGKDHLTCGKGADVIRYTDGAGKDTIKKFDGTQDKLIITDGAIAGVKVKGKNVELKVGDGSITIQKAVGQEITIKDESGAESTYAFTKKNNTLDTALVSTSEQLSVTKYWFEVDVQTDPLEGLLNNKNAALGADDITDKKEIFKTAETD